MSLQTERLETLFQRLGLADMAKGYQALAEQAAQKDLLTNLAQHLRIKPGLPTFITLESDGSSDFLLGQVAKTIGALRSDSLH